MSQTGIELAPAAAAVATHCKFDPATTKKRTTSAKPSVRRSCMGGRFNVERGIAHSLVILERSRREWAMLLGEIFYALSTGVPNDPVASTNRCLRAPNVQNAKPRRHTEGRRNV